MRLANRGGGGRLVNASYWYWGVTSPPSAHWTSMAPDHHNYARHLAKSQWFPRRPLRLLRAPCILDPYHYLLEPSFDHDTEPLYHFLLQMSSLTAATPASKLLSRPFKNSTQQTDFPRFKSSAPVPEIYSHPAANVLVQVVPR